MLEFIRQHGKALDFSGALIFNVLAFALASNGAFLMGSSASFAAAAFIASLLGMRTFCAFLAGASLIAFVLAIGIEVLA